MTNTAVLEKFGLDPRTMPMKPMSVEQCVSEGLSALRENRSRILPGRMNRINERVGARLRETDVYSQDARTHRLIVEECSCERCSK